jgi:hypothetical protein
MGRLSQINPENINSEATKSSNDLNDYLKKTVKINLIFCKLEVKSLHDVFYSDASFAGNLEISSQIGGIILLKKNTVMRMSCTGFQEMSTRNMIHASS